MSSLRTGRHLVSIRGCFGDSVTSMNGAVGLSHGQAVFGDKSEESCLNDVLQGDFLKTVLDLTLQNKLVTGMDQKEKVVDFKHPSELQKLMKLDIENVGCTKEELLTVCEQSIKYSVKTTHPHFYNQLYGGIDEIALGGAWLTEALNTNLCTFEVAPVFIVVEKYMLQLICKLFGFSDGDGIFCPGGSMSNMYGMMLARHQRYPEMKNTGVFGHKPLVAFTSDMSHYSILKGSHWLGLGYNNVVKVATDDAGRMIPKALEKAIDEVLAEGREPFFVNGTAGTTVLGAFDPIEEISDVCKKYKLWLHIDGCWGGSVVLSEKHRHLLKGIERADSISWNAHKMLGASLQTSAFIVRHKGLMHHCNSAAATYLFQEDKFYDAHFDTGDKSIQCGRKVDAFRFWILLKAKGFNSLGALVDNCFDAATYLLEAMRSREGFRVVLESPQCTNICFWYIPPSLRGAKETSEWWKKISTVAPTLKERMTKAGTMMIGYQPMKEKGLVNFFRMVTTCVPPPTKQDMDFVLDQIERLGADL